MSIRHIFQRVYLQPHYKNVTQISARLVWSGSSI